MSNTGENPPNRSADRQGCGINSGIGAFRTSQTVTAHQSGLCTEIRRYLTGKLTQWHCSINNTTSELMKVNKGKINVKSRLFYEFCVYHTHINTFTKQNYKSPRIPLLLPSISLPLFSWLPACKYEKENGLYFQIKWFKRACNTFNMALKLLPLVSDP